MYNTILTRGQLSSVYRGIYKVKSLTMHVEYNYKYESLPVKESSGTASTPKLHSVHDIKNKQHECMILQVPVNNT